MGPINVNCAETIFKQTTSAHHFINNSQTILDLWMRLIFPETRHPGLQFEHKNETITIRIELDMIFQNWFYMLLQQLRENRTWLTPHSHQSFHLMHQIFPKAKMRSRFIILCQPLLMAFHSYFLHHYYINSQSPSFQSRQKTPISSLLLSSSDVK